MSAQPQEALRLELAGQRAAEDETEQPAPARDENRKLIITVEPIENAWLVYTNEGWSDRKRWSYRSPTAVAGAVKALLSGKEPPN